MSKYIVEPVTAEDISEGAFSYKTGDPVQLETGSVHWAVFLLDDDGEQANDDFSFYATRDEADAACRDWNEWLAADEAAA